MMYTAAGYGVWRLQRGLSIEQKTHMDHRDGVTITTEYRLVESIHPSLPYGSLIAGGLTRDICAFDEVSKLSDGPHGSHSWRYSLDRLYAN